MASDFNRPQETSFASRLATVQVNVCRCSHRATGSRLLQPNRLSPDPVAVSKAEDLTTGNLTRPHTDGDVLFLHGSVQTTRSRVAPNRIRGT